MLTLHQLCLHVVDKLLHHVQIERWRRRHLSLMLLVLLLLLLRCRHGRGSRVVAMQWRLLLRLLGILLLLSHLTCLQNSCGENRSKLTECYHQSLVFLQLPGE